MTKRSLFPKQANDKTIITHYPHLLSATVRVYPLVAPCHLPDFTSLALLWVSSRSARAF